MQVPELSTIFTPGGVLHTNNYQVDYLHYITLLDTEDIYISR